MTTMTTGRSIAVLAGVLGMMTLLGCQGAPAPKAGQPKPQPVLDGCSERLHSLCEPLLLSYAAHKRFPGSLDELRRGNAKLSLTCPVSGKPYEYNPDGLEVLGRSLWVIVYDSVPCHSGLRWTIVCEAPRPGKPLVPFVLNLDSSAVAWPQTATDQSSPPTHAPGTTSGDEHR